MTDDTYHVTQRHLHAGKSGITVTESRYSQRYDGTKMHAC